MQKDINILWTTSLSGKKDCLEKSKCTVILVESYFISVHKLFWDLEVGGAREAEILFTEVQGSAVFFLQIFFTSHSWFMVIATLLFFFFLSYPDLLFAKWNCLRQRIYKDLGILIEHSLVSFPINSLLWPQSCSSFDFIARYQIWLLFANSTYFANKCYFFYYLAKHTLLQHIARGMQVSFWPIENKYCWLFFYKSKGWTVWQ